MKEGGDLSPLLDVLIFGSIASYWFLILSEVRPIFRRWSLSKVKKNEVNDGGHLFRSFLYTEGATVPQDVTHIEVHRSTKVLRRKAFAGLRHLEEVILHEGLQIIEANAFHDCCSLKRINFPSSLLAIGRYAFWGCRLLTEAPLSQGLQLIGRFAFICCNSLERIRIPSTVTSIGMGAFYDCTSLEDVTLMGGTLTIEEGAFDDLCYRSFEKIELPSRAFVAEAGANSEFCCRLVTNKTFTNPDPRGEVLIIIAPQSLVYISQLRLVEVGNAINTIMNSSERWAWEITEDTIINRAENRFHGREKILEHVHALITYHALVEVSSLLELALWKTKMVIEYGAGGGRVDNLNGSVRNICRIKCGSDEIIPNVLAYI